MSLILKTATYGGVENRQEISQFLNNAFSRRTNGENPLDNIENGNDMIFEAQALIIEALAKQGLISADKIVEMDSEHYSGAKFEEIED